MIEPALRELLAGHQAETAAFVRRSAGRVLRYESAEDLVQGVQVRALEHAAGFEYRSPAQFIGWLHAVARSHFAERHSYWNALRRRPARLVRLGTAADTDGRRNEPSATSTGPSTFASRREQVAIALRALAVLLPRDRDFVRWTCEDVPTEQQAARAGISTDAAAKARQRAIERFRKAFELTSRA